MSKRTPQQDVVEAYSLILKYFGRDNDLSKSDLENMKGSAQRAAKALGEMTKTKTQIAKFIKEEVISRDFPLEDNNATGSAGLITQGPIDMYSLCPHHLLTVEYTAYVSYIPKKGGKVLGLSKLSRISQELAKRPVLQEQLASDIADVLHYDKKKKTGFPSIDSEGSAVNLVGRHLCMACRGVMSNALTGVTELRGVFWKENMENKFYKAIERNERSKLLK